MLSAIPEYFAEHTSGVGLVRIVLFDQETVDEFVRDWESGSQMNRE
jgi:hypothetical protein